MKNFIAKFSDFVEIGSIFVGVGIGIGVDLVVIGGTFVEVGIAIGIQIWVASMFVENIFALVEIFVDKLTSFNIKTIAKSS